MPRFIKAESGAKNSVIYTDETGKNFVFSGGTRTWKNQNPGNLVSGSISKRHGQIGVAGGFAVFPDREAGHRALLDCLQTTYGNKDLEQMIRQFAPSSENDTRRYLSFLRKKTGVNDNRKIKDFSADEFESLWKAIEAMEGWKEGTITELAKEKQISRVRKNKKGVITHYFVEGIGWLTKEKGIELAENGEIDAVVAISRAGNAYLRTRPDVNSANNLENLG